MRPTSSSPTTTASSGPSSTSSSRRAARSKWCPPAPGVPPSGPYPVGPVDPPHFVVAYDYAIKRSILDQLVAAGCQVEVVPAGTTAAEVIAREPDGVFLSNGPGDPAAVVGARENVRAL